MASSFVRFSLLSDQPQRSDVTAKHPNTESRTKRHDIREIRLAMRALGILTETFLDISLVRGIG